MLLSNESASSSTNKNGNKLRRLWINSAALVSMSERDSPSSSARTGSSRIDLIYPAISSTEVNFASESVLAESKMCFSSALLRSSLLFNVGSFGSVRRSLSRTLLKRIWQSISSFFSNSFPTPTQAERTKSDSVTAISFEEAAVRACLMRQCKSRKQTVTILLKKKIIRPFRHLL